MDIKLIDTASELFKKYGIRSVSMDDICSKLGISKKTMYELVKNKEDLINKVLSKYIEQDEIDIDNLIAKAKNALDEMILISNHVITMFYTYNPRLSYELQKYYVDSWNMLSKEHFSFIERTIQHNIERGIEENLYRKNILPEFISKLYLANCQIIINDEKFTESTENQVEVYKQLIYYHLNGILNKNGKILFEKLNYNS